MTGYVVMMCVDVERGVVLREVNFSGPPPFLLEETQRVKVQEMVINM